MFILHISNIRRCFNNVVNKSCKFTKLILKYSSLHCHIRLPVNLLHAAVQFTGEIESDSVFTDEGESHVNNN